MRRRQRQTYRQIAQAAVSVHLASEGVFDWMANGRQGKWWLRGSLLGVGVLRTRSLATCHLVLLPSGPGGAEQRSEVRGRQRLTEQEALGAIATLRSEMVELGLGFDSLGDDAQGQILAKGDDGLDETGIVQVVGHIVNEAGGDIEGIDRKAFQLLQTGASGPKVVNGNP